MSEYLLFDGTIKEINNCCNCSDAHHRLLLEILCELKRIAENLEIMNHKSNKQKYKN